MKKLLALLIVGLGAVYLLHQSTPAQAYTCYKDPDYHGGGSSSIPESECQNQPIYNYTGSGSNFAIKYEKKSSSGTITTVGTFKVVDPKADPLIFSGSTIYGTAVRIQVPRSSFDSSGTRYNSLTDTTSVQLNLGTAGKAFADAHGINYQGASVSCPKLGTPGLKNQINCNSTNPIYALLQYVINWAVRLLLALAVLAIIISGIQYITSQGNPEGIKAAKGRLTNAIVGLILLSLMFVILKFIGVRVK
jgi:hypothetical protein